MIASEVAYSLPCWIVLYAVSAAFIDLSSRRIPNSLTYGGILFGLGIGLLPQFEPSLANSLLGLLIAFAPSLILFALGSIGGGDVKLLTALGALLGYPQILDVLFYTIVFGSAWGITVIIWRGRVLDTLKGFRDLLVSLLYPGSYKIVPVQDLSIPFGVPIAIATLWAVFDLGHNLMKLISG